MTSDEKLLHIVKLASKINQVNNKYVAFEITMHSGGAEPVYSLYTPELGNKSFNNRDECIKYLEGIELTGEVPLIRRNLLIQLELIQQKLIALEGDIND